MNDLEPPLGKDPASSTATPASTVSSDVVPRTPPGPLPRLAAAAVGAAAAAALAWGIFGASAGDRELSQAVEAMTPAQRIRIARQIETMESIPKEEVARVRQLAESIAGESDQTRRRRLMAGLRAYRQWETGLSLAEREAVSPEKSLTDRKAAVRGVVEDRKTRVGDVSGGRLKINVQWLTRLASVVSGPSTSGDPLVRLLETLFAAVEGHAAGPPRADALRTAIAPVADDVLDLVPSSGRLSDRLRRDGPSRVDAAVSIVLLAVFIERGRRLAATDVSDGDRADFFSGLSESEQNELLELSQAAFERELTDRVADRRLLGDATSLTTEEVALVREAAEEFREATRFRSPRRGPPDGGRPGGGPPGGGPPGGGRRGPPEGR